MLEKGSTVDFETFKEYHPHYMVGIYVPGSPDGTPQPAKSIRFEIGEDSPYPDEWIIEGQTLAYTGQGKVKDGDQKWNRYNNGMRIAFQERLPVMVFEKMISGRYKYHGEWFVVDHGYRTVQKTGQRVIRFTVMKNIDERAAPSEVEPIVSDEASEDVNEPPARVRAETYRILRDTRLSRRMKEREGFACEVCGMSLVIKGRRYAEAHHIVPLGRPHNGLDVESNILVLCPNHHAMFDYGELRISEENGCHVLNSRGERVAILGKR